MTQDAVVSVVRTWLRAAFDPALRLQLAHLNAVLPGCLAFDAMGWHTWAAADNTWEVRPEAVCVLCVAGPGHERLRALAFTQPYLGERRQHHIVPNNNIWHLSGRKCRH